MCLAPALGGPLTHPKATMVVTCAWQFPGKGQISPLSSLGTVPHPHQQLPSQSWLEGASGCSLPEHRGSSLGGGLGVLLCQAAGPEGRFCVLGVLGGVIP